MECNKKKRIVDRKLLNEIKKLPCIVCGRRPADPAHIKSKGTGGNDIPENCIPLCRTDHITQHAMGIGRFIIRNRKLKEYLKSIGWTFNGVKPLHPKA